MMKINFLATLISLFTATLGFVPVDLNVATYNIYQIPLAIYPEQRKTLKTQYLTETLESNDIDVLCLQEVPNFPDEMHSFLYDDENLMNEYPYVYSILDELSDELNQDEFENCDSAETTALTSGCFDNCASFVTALDVTGFALCAALSCPADYAVVQRGSCIGCVFSKIPQGIEWESIKSECTSTQDASYILTGGLALLSKYPIHNPRIYELLSNWDALRYLLTADVEIENKQGKTKMITVGCVHVFAHTSFSDLQIPYFSFDANVIAAGVSSYLELQEVQAHQINDIFNNNDIYKGKAKVLLGDLNTYDETNPPELVDAGAAPSVYEIFINDGWKNTLDMNCGKFNNFDEICTWCNDLNDNINDNICNSDSDVNPLISAPEQPYQLIVDHVLVKDFCRDTTRLRRCIQVERFLEECYEITVDSDTIQVPISDHYAVKARLRLLF